MINIKNFMNESYNFNTFENDEFTLKSEESDYKNLITKLKKMGETIAQLEKIINL